VPVRIRFADFCRCWAHTKLLIVDLLSRKQRGLSQALFALVRASLIQVARASTLARKPTDGTVLVIRQHRSFDTFASEFADKSIEFSSVLAFSGDPILDTPT
jgi:hypothetical protein